MGVKGSKREGLEVVGEEWEQKVPAPYTIRPLGAATWDAFAELVQRNNGIYGGCWCVGNHCEYRRGVSDPRTLKEQLVRAGRAHAALVFDQHGLAQGWCQYGGADDLRIKHMRAYQRALPPRARWRIACIFVDKRHRGQGVARAALEGALSLIAAAGGGLVEAISETVTGREAQGRFLFSATVELFEQYGFTRGRQVGKHAWIVIREIGSTYGGGQIPVDPPEPAATNRPWRFADPGIDRVAGRCQAPCAPIPRREEGA